MPSIFTHPVVPIAIGLALGQRIISRRLLAAGAIASVLPDLDVIAFKIGIPYAHDFGHRGATHSIFFAILLGLVALGFSSKLNTSRTVAFLFVSIATASHGLLDMFTTGGLGIALAWPISSERFFFPYQVVQVSPIGIERFFSSVGLSVIASELLWIWMPSVILAATAFGFRQSFGSRR